LVAEFGEMSREAFTGFLKQTLGNAEMSAAMVLWHSFVMDSRPFQRTGVISSRAILGGLHNRYAWV
jgi:hypothetical protein